MILDFGLRIADFGLRPSEIGSPCGILRRRFRLTAEIPQGKHFTGQGFWIEAPERDLVGIHCCRCNTS